MLETEKNKLLQGTGKYVSIGITQDGESRCRIGIPWELTVHAYNMRTPNVYLTEEDLHDEEVLSLLNQYEVFGCYAFTPLQDYAVIAQFPHLQDIYLRQADTLSDLSFMRDLNECRMLFIENARLKDLAVIADVKRRNKYSTLSCFALSNCIVEDASALEGPRCYFREFLVWNPKSRPEREKWKNVSAHICRYFEFKD